MDRGQFDTLARLVSSKRSRRAAVAALLGAALLGHDPAALAKGGGRVNAQARTRAKAKPCYPGASCTPGRGRNNSGCDFAFSTVFHNKDVRGSNLSNSSFRGADLQGADFRGTNLSGACLVAANLHKAKLGNSVNLAGAILCNTIMPDGSVDASGCDKTTRCCPHLLLDCPDMAIDCWTTSPGDGTCATRIGSLGSVGTCYQFPSCCPCDHPDEAYWAAQCNQTFIECEDSCAANIDGILAGCVACPGQILEPGR